jgi:hypothetical protein
MKFIFLAAVLFFSYTHAAGQKPKREYYQLTTYYFKNAEQEKLLDNYLSNAYLPALHKRGIRQVGVFKPIANDTARNKQVMIVVPLPSLESLQQLQAALLTNKEHNANGDTYLNAPYNAPPYQRMETTILYAFELAPKMELPQLKSPKADRVYEYRSYESPTEALYRNKVKMFNAGGEIALFKRLGFNAIFYGEVLVGDDMPNLIYMTSFENMEERNKHWKTFSEDAEWKTLSSMPEYKNNVSRAEIVLMRAAPYSDY